MVGPRHKRRTYHVHPPKPRSTLSHSPPALTVRAFCPGTSFRARRRCGHRGPEHCRLRQQTDLRHQRDQQGVSPAWAPLLPQRLRPSPPARPPPPRPALPVFVTPVDDADDDAPGPPGGESLKLKGVKLMAIMLSSAVSQLQGRSQGPAEGRTSRRPPLQRRTPARPPSCWNRKPPSTSRLPR